MSVEAQTNIEQFNFLQKMVQVDDIAHKRDTVLEGLTGNIYNTGRDELFHRADYNYHKAQYRDEKYQAAKALLILMKEQCDLLMKIGYEHTQDKNIFLQLEEQIENTQLN